MLKQAVFLVGGRGTRLGRLTDDTPKPLLPIGGRPFLDFLVEKAARHGLGDVVLLASYLGERVAAHYAANPIPGATVRVAIEPKPLGTGGALAAARSLLDERFLLANGDTLFDFNWLDLAAASGDAPAALALRAIDSPGRYSAVTLEGGRILRFGEMRDGGGGCLINGGVYVLSRDAVPAAAGGPVSLETDVFPRLAAIGGLAGFVADGYFIDIGVPADYARAETEVPARAARKAIIFDRDGTLNVDGGYTHDWREFTWMPGAREAIKLANDRGYLVFVVTNQAGVAHGYYEEAAIQSLHARMNETLATLGARVNRFEYCPHHPEGARAEYRRSCPRRKPAPGMLLSCLAAWGLAPGDCLMVGDKEIDMEAARAAGISGHRYSGGNLRDFIAPLLAS